MNCFMGYNPLVAKDVKVTTWIKEFDGAEPVAPIFPAEGDCFIVFATDEDATTHNALSSKTYKDGEWVDAESGGGGGGGGGYPMFSFIYNEDSPPEYIGNCNMTYDELKAYITEYAVEVVVNTSDYTAVPCFSNNGLYTSLSFAYLKTPKSDYYSVYDGSTPLDTSVVTEGIAFDDGWHLLGNDGNYYIMYD